MATEPLSSASETSFESAGESTSKVDSSATTATIQSAMIKAFHDYWPKQTDLIEALPVPEFKGNADSSFNTVEIPLPAWGQHCGVEGKLLVPALALIAGSQEARWQQVDWWWALDWFLHSRGERAVEAQLGPRHSYSARLPGYDPKLSRHAWGNRIALFLRCWAGHLQNDQSSQNTEPSQLFGPLPKAKVYLTHDVDAVSKTLPIRLKQCAFLGFNSLRALCQGQVKKSAAFFAKALRFLLEQDNYWCFDTIAQLEQQAGYHSAYFFYAGEPVGITQFKTWLLDPGYDVSQGAIKQQQQTLLAQGHQVGLHQNFAAWQSPESMLPLKQRLDGNLPKASQACRQHWLRFSFADTWQAQQQVGFNTDFTLGFNDRPGFRNSCALAFHPELKSETLITSGLVPDARDFKAIPTVLMDGQLYDYQPMTPDEQRQEMRFWLQELLTVGGCAAIIWHQRVFSQDYQWQQGYETLLSLLQELDIACGFQPQSEVVGPTASVATNTNGSD